LPLITLVEIPICTFLCAQLAAAGDHFGTWILEQKMEVHDINDSVVDRYLLGLG